MREHVARRVCARGTEAVKDPPGSLNKEKCLQALAELRHSKWFQVISLVVIIYVVPVSPFKKFTLLDICLIFAPRKSGRLSLTVKFEGANYVL